MEGAQTSGGLFSQRTAWARNIETPLRQFLRTETGSAAVRTCDRRPLQPGATIASVVMDVAGRRMWLADGPPCEVPHLTAVP